jgi:HK97 gp10 family phage protein
MLGDGAKIEWDDRQLTIDINKSMDSKLRASAELVASYARKNVGIVSGKLRKSIKVEKSKFKDGGYLVKVGGHEDRTYYWFFVEYGTVDMLPTWFMRWAIRQAKAKIRRLFKKAA